MICILKSQFSSISHLFKSRDYAVINQVFAHVDAFNASHHVGPGVSRKIALYFTFYDEPQTKHDVAMQSMHNKFAGW
jgi:hypothetical protein